MRAAEHRPTRAATRCTPLAVRARGRLRRRLSEDSIASPLPPSRFLLGDAPSPAGNGLALDAIAEVLVWNGTGFEVSHAVDML